MPFTAQEAAALQRLLAYYDGDNPYDPDTNPGGMRLGGHRFNFEPALQDVARVAAGMGALVDQALEAIEDAIAVYGSAEALTAAVVAAQAAAQQAADYAANGYLRFTSLAGLSAYTPNRQPPAGGFYYAEVEGDGSNDGAYRWAPGGPWVRYSLLTLRQAIAAAPQAAVDLIATKGVTFPGGGEIGHAVPTKTRSARRFWFKIKDQSERTVAGVDPDGVWYAFRLAIDTLKRTGRSVPAFAEPISDLRRRVAIGIRPGGRVLLGGLDLVVRRTRARSVPAFADALRDLRHRTGFGVQPDGRVRIAPSLSSGPAIGEALTPPADAITSSVGKVMGLRYGRSGLVAATVWERSSLMAYDVLRRRGGRRTALVDHPSPLRVVLGYGQSQWMLSGASVAALTTPLYPHHCVMFPEHHDAGAGATIAADMREFTPLVDAVGAIPWLGTAVGFAIEGRDRLAGRDSPGLMVGAHHAGGQPLTTFVVGTQAYTNLLALARAVVATAAAYGRSVVFDVSFIQGESGPYNQSQWVTLFTSLAASIRTDLQAISGQTRAPYILLSQINGNDNATGFTGVEYAQVDVGRSLAASGVILAGPMYQCPLSDEIHGSTIGRMVLGDLLSEVYARVVTLGQAFAPLWPTSTVRTGNLIDQTWNLPPGTSALAWDDGSTSPQWVPSLTNRGATYEDSTTSATITSVAITGANTTRITLSGTPTGANKAVRWGVGSDTLVDGWAGPRTQLMAVSTAPSVFAPLGYAVPSAVRHYAVKTRDNAT